MNEQPYSHFADESLTLRDKLAIARTILANERTFLAHIRTALAVFIAGISMIQFFDTLLMTVMGWVFIAMGLSMVIIGLSRYKTMGKTFGIKRSTLKKEKVSAEGSK